MATRAIPASQEGPKMLLLHVFFQGPWERASAWLWCHDTDREVHDGSLRDRLACFCDKRDTAWRKRWAARWPERPKDKWRRPDA